MATVYARRSAAVGRGNSGSTVVSKGDAYDDSHPIVRAHPGLFTSEPVGVAGTVERATRAPGEMRATPAKGPAKS